MGWRLHIRDSQLKRGAALNVQTDTDFVLVVAWAFALLAQSRPLSGARAIG